MNRIKQIAIALIAAISLSSSVYAAVPWGSTAPLQQNSATPTCTYTATALACINLMGANTTSVTLAGMTAGTYYTFIPLQDGTGSRTLTQTSITGAPALTTAESAANGYAVWVIKATSASKAAFVADYPNQPLWKIWTAGSQATAGTAITGAASQAQATFVVPGMTTSDWCNCAPQVAVDATWATDFVKSCTPFTNGVACNILNPGAATTTPSATTLNIRIMQ